MFAWFAETTIVAAILAAVATLASRSGKLGPAVRHALWLVVLVKMSLPPIVSWPDAWRPSFSPTISAKAEAMEKPCDVAFRPTLVEPLRPQLTPQEPPSPLAPPIEDLGSQLAEPAPPVELPSPVVTASIQGEVDEEAQSDLATPPAPRAWRMGREEMRRIAGWAWLLGAVVYGACQAWRMARFADALKRAKPAPEWLQEIIEDLALRFGVRAPASLVIEGAGSPFLWCAGRPRLVVPSAMLGRLESGCWEDILAHEMAHLRRRDPWVCRWTLLAGAAWWWNPLFWLVRSRLESEAELACDALAASARPGGRRRLAESLVAVCEAMAAKPAPPALGVGSEGRFLERRLLMILNGNDSGRLPIRGALAAMLLAALAAPSWTLAQDAPPADPPKSPAAPSPDALPPPPPAVVPATPAAPVPPLPPLAPAAAMPAIAPIPPLPPNAAPPVSADSLAPPRAEADDGVKPAGSEDADAAREQLKTLTKQLETLRRQTADTNAQINRLRGQISASEARARTQVRARRGADAAPRAASAPRADSNIRTPRASDDAPMLTEPPTRSADTLRGRGRPATDPNEIDRLNRRMDSMEQKLDMLLKKLEEKPSSDRRPEPARAGNVSS